MSAAALPAAPAAERARALSPSQASAYLQCAAMWYFRHALKLPEPRTASMAQGSAIHRAAAAALRGRGVGAAFDAADVCRIYDTVLAEELAAAELRDEDDPAAIAAQGRAMIALYVAQVLPHAAPERVEEPVSGVIAGIPVRGVADLIEPGTVAELKTAARRPAGVAAAHRLQLTTYCMLTGRGQARVDTLVSTKQPAHVRHSLAIGPADVAHAEAIYPLAAECMASGLYPPNRGSVLCSRRNCAFWRNCEREFGGSVD